MKVESSVVIDDCTEKKFGPCEFTAVFDFPDASDEDVDGFVEAIKRAIG